MDELTRPKMGSVNGHAMWYIHQRNTWTYPAIPAMKLFLLGKGGWEASKEAFGTHGHQFVVMDVTQPTVEDGPVAEIMLAERFIDGRWNQRTCYNGGEGVFERDEHGEVLTIRRTNTIYVDTPAIDNGCKQAQFGVGTKTMFTDVYAMKTNRRCINTLERERGVMNELISNSIKVDTSKCVLTILHALCISNWKSEPYQQHQNPAERRYQTAKRMRHNILDRSGSPHYTWLLALGYVCFIINYTLCGAINGIPTENLTGSTTDIIPLLRFSWYQPVHYKVEKSDFPSETRE